MNKGGLNKNKKHGKEKVKLYKKKKTVCIDDVIKKLQEAYDQINPKEIQKFVDIPLSNETQRGLKQSGYFEPTEIQKESIGYALQGNDILGAAKTGSGKTLAFLIPVLEKLFSMKWTRLDGTGALIITPTRELAYQIFETLRKIGFYHDFSAGLVIGGKDLKFELKRMDNCNIVICTPGRLLHHMDENPLFDCVNLQILVLDEADRCLDLGFEDAMNNIIANLPLTRQTLLFSATQTKSVRDLARLSLKNPKYISVHENSSYSTPEGLTQSYMVCELEEKLSVLWSFVRTHFKHKILVFLSSCKQVKYTFEIFCQLRPKIALLALYGSLHQQKRMDIYRSFCNKEHAVLFATDIAARGLDFPAVNWVIQMDCPEDATAYIHRVGRTARYHKGGEALLILLPSEKEAMLANLQEKKIPINEIKVNPRKLQNPRVKVEAILARRLELKQSAQRAFVAYVKSVFLMKDKKVFNVNKLKTDEYARSLGLVIPPRIRFLQKLQKNQAKKEKPDLNDNDKNEISFKNIDFKSSDSDDNENNESDTDLKHKKKNKLNKVTKSNEKLRKYIAIKSETAENSSVDDDDDSDYRHEQNQRNKSDSKFQSKQIPMFDFGMDETDDEDILTLKRVNHDLDDDDNDEEAPPLVPIDEPGRRKKKALTKVALAKRILKKNIIPNKKIIFSEDGEVIDNKYKQRVTELGRKYEEDDDGGINIEEAQKVLREEDKIDKQLFKERMKTKRRKERMKLKKLKKGSDNDSDEGENGDFDENPETFDNNSESENEDEFEENSVQSDDDIGDNFNNSDEDIEDFHSSSDDEIAISRNIKKGKKRRNNSNEDDSREIKIHKTSLSQAEDLALMLLKSSSR